MQAETASLLLSVSGLIYSPSGRTEKAAVCRGDVSSSIPLLMEMKSQQHLIFISTPRLICFLFFFVKGGVSKQYIVYHNSNSIECLS